MDDALVGNDAARLRIISHFQKLSVIIKGHSRLLANVWQGWHTGLVSTGSDRGLGSQDPGPLISAEGAKPLTQ